jgi:hypothetical protein
MTLLRRFAIAAALIAGSVSAQATLIDRGGGMIYDTELNVTWLQDWNYAKTSGYSGDGVFGDGRMNWNAAVKWADDLTYGGYGDWRLPTMIDTGTAGCNLSNAGGTDCGFNVQTKSGNTVYSELAHLYYVTLGNLGRCRPGDSACFLSQPGWGLRNVGPFSNLQGGAYWFGVQDASASFRSWYFVTSDGYQDAGFKLSSSLVAVAVRNGDVTPVPEPQTMGLALTALGALLLAMKKRAC